MARKHTQHALGRPSPSATHSRKHQDQSTQHFNFQQSSAHTQAPPKPSLLSRIRRRAKRICGSFDSSENSEDNELSAADERYAGKCLVYESELVGGLVKDDGTERGEVCIVLEIGVARAVNVGRVTSAVNSGDGRVRIVEVGIGEDVLT